MLISVHQGPIMRDRMKEILILQVSVLLVTSVVGAQETESASLSRRDDDATLSSLQALVQQQAAVSQQQAAQIAQQAAKMEQQALLIHSLQTGMADLKDQLKHAETKGILSRS